MKPNLSYETIKVNKMIFNKNLEHNIDFEYQLPDYYTGIFKVLQFNFTPHISTCRSSNKQFIVDGNVLMKLLYIDEENGEIKSIHQNIPFSKTVDLEEDMTDSILFYDVKTSYKNCKIVNSKKLDVKSTLIISVKGYSQKEEIILKNTNDNNIQLKYTPISITSNQIFDLQQFNINEQVELSTATKEILDVKILISDEEHKIISNKIICKAVAHIEILHCGDTKNTPILERSSIQLNNVINVKNISDKFLYNIKYEVTSINFEILQEGKVINVQADITLNSYANLLEKIKVVTDAFSTKYEVNASFKEFTSSTIISTINENKTVEENISNIGLNKIYTVDADIVNLNKIKNEENVEFDVKLNLNILGANKDETLENFSKIISLNFKMDNKTNYIFNDFTIDDLTILKIKHNLKNNDNLEIQFDFLIKGYIFYNNNLKILKEVLVDKNKAKKRSKAALTLYYPKQGEKIWNIAKSFCTSPNAIIEANNLEEDYIKDETMLIIPII